MSVNKKRKPCCDGVNGFTGGWWELNEALYTNEGEYESSELTSTRRFNKTLVCFDCHKRVRLSTIKAWNKK